MRTDLLVALIALASSAPAAPVLAAPEQDAQVKAPAPGFASGGARFSQTPSLRDLREEDEIARRLASEVAYTSSVCGAPISSAVEWRSLGNWPAFADLVSACDGALGAVEASCRAGRTRLVRRFVCAGDASGPSLSGGVLRFGASPVGDAFAETKALLDRQP